MSLSNRDVFLKEIFNIPKKRDGVDIYNFIKGVYKQYLITIKAFNGQLKSGLLLKTPIIETECKAILEALELYLKGFPSQAYMKLTECLNTLNKEGVLEIRKSTTTSGVKEFYRIRVATNLTYHKEDLFHVPFELREKVATQRYSIPGLPCLYLADSIFVCWEELKRPNFDSIHVSRFDLSNSGFKLLYLNISVDEMRNRCFKTNSDGTHINQLIQYLTYWPLLCACSMVVSRQDDSFKPEYVIPQLVLQWVMSDKNVDGIQYKSNRVKSSSYNIGTFTNVVIPAKQFKKNGFCSKLLKSVRLTSPISWQLLDIAVPKQIKRGLKGADIQIDNLRRASYIELVENEKTLYLESKFGILEEKLRNMKLGYITKT